ncbi:MAG: hypothetical protein EBU66_13685 [Bacteroidetes bacterium]|jgi:hypothetical protein|nr:hypothetical protein [Bacteroidota bacterium]
MDEPSGVVDGVLRMIVILGLLGWNAFEALSLRTPYPSSMVALWESPIWRLTLLFIVWVGAEWCPRVGLLTGMAVLMYIVNMIQVV